MAEEVKDSVKNDTKGMACSPNHKILAVVIIGAAVIVILGAGAFSV